MSGGSGDRTGPRPNRTNRHRRLQRDQKPAREDRLPGRCTETVPPGPGLPPGSKNPHPATFHDVGRVLATGEPPHKTHQPQNSYQAQAHWLMSTLSSGPQQRVSPPLPVTDFGTEAAPRAQRAVPPAILMSTPLSALGPEQQPQSDRMTAACWPLRAPHHSSSGLSRLSEHAQPTPREWHGWRVAKQSRARVLTL